MRQGLGFGEKLLIADSELPVATRTSELARSPCQQHPRLELAKGMITILSDDDDNLKIFKECMSCECLQAKDAACSGAPENPDICEICGSSQYFGF